MSKQSEDVVDDKDDMNLPPPYDVYANYSVPAKIMSEANLLSLAPMVFLMLIIGGIAACTCLEDNGYMEIN